MSNKKLTPEEVQAAKEQAAAEKEAKAAARAAEKEAKAQAAAEAKAQKEAERAAKIAEKEAAKLARITEREPEQNGMRRPKPGTKTRAIWDLCDQLSAELQRPVAIAELRAALPEGTNENTIRTQYAFWRKFYGITGRIEGNKDLHEGLGETDPSEV